VRVFDVVGLVKNGGKCCFCLIYIGIGAHATKSSHLCRTESLCHGVSMHIGTTMRETASAQLIVTLLLALELHIAAILAELVHTTMPMEIGFAVVQERNGEIERLRGLVMHMGELSPPEPGAERKEESHHASHPVHKLSVVLGNESKTDAIVGFDIQNPGLAAMPAGEITEEIDPTENLLRDGFTHGRHSFRCLRCGDGGRMPTSQPRGCEPSAADGAHESDHDCPLLPESGDFWKGLGQGLRQGV